jgi:signal transduction histidine kinase
MEDRNQTMADQLESLAAHLSERRGLILHAWRKAVDADPELSAPSSLPRTQFNDHVPEMLDAFERRLLAGLRRESAGSKEQRNEVAAGHGLQRWQQGYHLREVTREWGHLQLCLVHELESYALLHPELDSSVMPVAWRALAELCSQGVSESTTKYFHLQQTEAEGHVRDLQQTLEQVHDLERRRTELFRQAAHDLRGNFGVVKNVTSGLTQYDLTEPMRDEFLELLQKSVSSLQSMLDDVMDLARLQAGHELRDVKPIDVAALLRELCEQLLPLAVERGLYLKTVGPSTLSVEGDAIKIRRIAQNLVLNGLKVTQAGGVTVSWGDSRNNDSIRWMLCVQDTGPGFHAGPGSPLAGALEEATDESREVERHSAHHHVKESSTDRPPVASVHGDDRPVHQERGEGIGLSIVKRLCELLDATVELESEPNEGTLFRVVIPRSYSTAKPMD